MFARNVIKEVRCFGLAVSIGFLVSVVSSRWFCVNFTGFSAFLALFERCTLNLKVRRSGRTVGFWQTLDR